MIDVETYGAAVGAAKRYTDEHSGSDDAVKYTEQTLTTTQQAQARENIGAANAADVETALADKISKSQTAGLVKNDGTIDTTNYVSDISGKADKVSGATNGNFAGLDIDGNLTDSGVGLNNFFSRYSVSKNLNSAGWYKIAKITTRGKVAAGLLFLQNLYVSTTNESSVISLNVGYDTSHTKFNVLHGGNDNPQSAVRIIKDGSNLFLEIYYRTSANNTVYAEMLGNFQNIEMISYELDDSASPTIMGSVSTVSDTFATKVSSPTAGNFAALDANGNLADSEKKASDFIVPEAVTGYDATKTQVLKNINGALMWVDDL